jgi:hypothetical protein
VLILLDMMAPQHMGHGSKVVYRVQPEKSTWRADAPALRSASVSA